MAFQAHAAGLGSGHAHRAHSCTAVEMVSAPLWGHSRFLTPTLKSFCGSEVGRVGGQTRGTWALQEGSPAPPQDAGFQPASHQSTWDIVKHQPAHRCHFSLLPLSQGCSSKAPLPAIHLLGLLHGLRTMGFVCPASSSLTFSGPFGNSSCLSGLGRVSVMIPPPPAPLQEPEGPVNGPGWTLGHPLPLTPQMFLGKGRLTKQKRSEVSLESMVGNGEKEILFPLDLWCQEEVGQGCG